MEKIFITEREIAIFFVSTNPSLTIASLTSEMRFPPLEKWTVFETLNNVEIIIGRVKELLAFPFTIIKIVDISQNDKTGADDLSKAIEADPVIVSTLLSVSNTVHFSRGGKRVSEVKEAIVRLGFVETKNIAISLSVMNLFSNEARSVGFNRYEFWYHSLACGIVSEIIARKAGYPRPEIAFICGLLHDFGIILLDEFFHSFFIAILSQVVRNKSNFVTEERRLWGMSHNTAVGFLFKEWNMPFEVTNAIGQQDIIGIKQLIDKKNPESLLVNIIGIGNLIAKCFQFGKDCDAVVHPLSGKTLEILNLSEGITSDLINTCIDRLNIYGEFFGLDRRFFSYPSEPEPDAHILNFIMHTNDVFNPHKYYLQTCGYKITQESSIEKIKSLDPQPHAILHIIDKSTPLKTLSPFLNIQKEHKYDSENKPDSFIPSIFITHDNRLDLQFDNVNYAYSLPSIVDVNLLSFIIEGLIAKQNIRNYYELIEPNGLDQQKEKQMTIQYLDKSVVLITLQGSINLSYFNELKKCFMKMIEKGVPNIAIQLSNITDIDNIIVNLLVNFQKKADDSGCNLCFCSIGKEIPGVVINHNIFKSVHVFDKEIDVIEYFTF